MDSIVKRVNMSEPSDSCSAPRPGAQSKTVKKVNPASHDFARAAGGRSGDGVVSCPMNFHRWKLVKPFRVVFAAW